MTYRVVNLGNTAYANYVVSIDAGAVLIDCGNNMPYEKFEKKLTKNGLTVGDIKYVVLTHVHCDHISYLTGLFEKASPVLIFGEGAAENLALGHDKLMTYSSKFNKKLSEMTAKLRGGAESWTPVDCAVYKTTTVTQEDSETLKAFGATLMPLKGHTLDSIGVLFSTGDFFIGDAVMNMPPSKHTLPLLIEDGEEFKQTYRKLMAVNATRYYPGHGKPFGVKLLNENAEYAKNVVLY